MAEVYQEDGRPLPLEIFADDAAGPLRVEILAPLPASSLTLTSEEEDIAKARSIDEGLKTEVVSKQEPFTKLQL